MAATNVADADRRAPARPRAARRGVPIGVVWVAIGVVLPAVATLAARLGTIDLAYHVRLGDLMLTTGRLARSDTFTFVANGRAWTDQQWLAQVLFALVYRAGAWQGLVVLRSLIVGATFTFVYLSCRGVGAARKTSALLALGSFAATILALALRPQLLAFALFAACVWALATHERHPRRVWIVPLLVAVWANVHGTFFLGPLLLGLAWIGERRTPASRRLLAATALSVAATFANPFGPGVWRYIVSISTNPAITKSVTEWAPPTVQDLAGLAFFVSIAATAVVFARRTRPVGWPTLLTLAVFLAIGLQSGRGMFWWDLLLPSILAAQFMSATDDAPERAEPPAPMVLVVGVVAVTVFTAVAFLPWLRAPGSGQALLNDAPAGLTAAVERATQPGSRIFDAQRLGSWLEFALPDRRVFVDSRIELFTASEWRDYMNVSAGVEGWQALLDRYGVDVVVATRGQQGTLLPRIRSDPGWTQSYADSHGSVFVRS
ncbi:MAG: hypothetical protein ACXVQU_12415 [Actinomycetota bacterium]